VVEPAAQAQCREDLARALTHEPRLLICDEPTSALDAESGHTTMRLLREVAVQPGRGVVIVTHDSRIFEFSDRTIYMEDGRVVSVRKGPMALGRPVPSRLAHGDEADEMDEF
jgi:putative ABC transport system ATP-binding protein